MARITRKSLESDPRIAKLTHDGRHYWAELREGASSSYQCIGGERTLTVLAARLEAEVPMYVVLGAGGVGIAGRFFTWKESFDLAMTFDGDAGALYMSNDPEAVAAAQCGR